MMKKGPVRNQLMNLWLPLLVVWILSACVAVPDENGDSMDKMESLQGTSWWVEDIAAKGVVDRSQTTIEFTSDGRIVGSTGCNRYFGSVEFDGSSMTMGPLAGTRKACPDALMDQENKFFRAMSMVVAWEIPATGLLHLRDAAGNSQLRASRIEP